MIASRSVMCPYCRHGAVLVCAHSRDHDLQRSCAACGGSFVVRFNVSIRATALEVQGEAERIADEQRERLELERGRAAAEASET